MNQLAMFGFYFSLNYDTTFKYKIYLNKTNGPHKQATKIFKFERRRVAVSKILLFYEVQEIKRVLSNGVKRFLVSQMNKKMNTFRFISANRTFS
jgi:hypothetical protein